MHQLVEHIIDLATRLGHWGYLLIFLVVLLECQALLGLFVPGESLVLVSGFLAGYGAFDLDAIIVTISAGAIVGDSIGYELGRHFGLGWLRGRGARVGIRERHFDQVERFIANHGGKSVFLSHFMHLLRALMPFVAGAHRMPYRRFVAFNAFGCVLWASIFSMVGYFVGESWPVIEKWIGRAGATVGALFVLLIILARLWSWLVQHEREIRAQWQGFITRPGIASFRRRFVRQIEFIEDRLTPGGYLGLHLTIGAAMVLLSGWWFGGIVQDLLAHDPLVTIDYRLAAWFNEHATPPLTRVASAVTFIASGPFLTTVAVVTALAMIWRRAWHRVAMLILAVGGGSLLNVGVKHLFHRPRPVVEHPLATLHTYSFPSGHTTEATLFYGLLAFFIVQLVQRWRWRVLAPLIAAFVILMVALSRLYLGLHYLSDVMGAMALGIMWLAISVTAVEINRRYRIHQREASRKSPP